MLLILAVSSVPRLRPPGSFGGWDKAIHAAEYAILGILLCRAVGRRGLLGAMAVLTMGVTIGSLDEWYQSSVPGRVPSMEDWLADVVGVGMGVIIYKIVHLVRRAETKRGEYRSR